jgi:hypothetical protein
MSGDDIRRTARERFEQARRHHESLKDWSEDLFLRCRAAIHRARNVTDVARQVHAFKRRMSTGDVARD